MIVSHKHKYIFVHCRKVAGSSMKVAMAPYLGSQDIIIGSINEIMASGVKINKATKKTLMKPKSIAYTTSALLIGKSWPEAVNIGVKTYYRNKLSPNPPHPTAKEAFRYFPYEWKNYFKFAFVRNPYERMASDYYWRLRVTRKNFSFKQYLEAIKNRSEKDNIVHPGAVTNWEMITINDKVEMDFVGKYENIENDFAYVMKQLSTPLRSLGLREKRGGSHSRYADLYGHEERKIVENFFEKEIVTFGYEFPFK